VRKIRSAKGDRPDAVALFLEGALGAGPVAVSELEAKARAAGLVGERQNLSDTKSFRSPLPSDPSEPVSVAAVSGPGRWRASTVRRSPSIDLPGRGHRSSMRKLIPDPSSAKS
jgi:hypothetical protein